MLADAKLETIEKLIGGEPFPTEISLTFQGSLNDESRLKCSTKGQVAKSAKLYAVKANCNRLLDVARETYKENIEDILNRR